MGGLMDYKARFYSSYINHFLQPDSLIPNPSNPQAWNRYAYVLNNPIRYNDPTGHCFGPAGVVVCGALLYDALVVYTGVAVYVGARTRLAQPDGNNASDIWELMKQGVNQADQVNITGEGLQSLQDDPSVKAKQDKIIASIKDDPRYGEQDFSISNDYTDLEDGPLFTADGPSKKFLGGLVTGNPAFLMVHSGYLYATNTKVSKDGTISTTWRVDDQFDYIPDWKNKGLAYNIGATISAPIYYGMLGAKRQFRTNAYWKATIPNNRPRHR
jgi:RHS repeat-associated protein